MLVPSTPLFKNEAGLWMPGFAAADEASPKPDRILAQDWNEWLSDLLTLNAEATTRRVTLRGEVRWLNWPVMIEDSDSDYGITRHHRDKSAFFSRSRRAVDTYDVTVSSGELGDYDALLYSSTETRDISGKHAAAGRVEVEYKVHTDEPTQVAIAGLYMVLAYGASEAPVATYGDYRHSQVDNSGRNL